MTPALSQPDSVVDASRRLAAELRGWRPGKGQTWPCRLRLTEPVDEVEPVAWLVSQPFDEKTYWSDRDASIEIAGIGCAHELKWQWQVSWPEIIGAIRQYVELDAGSACRYVGGVAFRLDSARRADDWEPFGAARFRLPQVELVREDGTLTLACNVVIGDAAAVEAEIARTAAMLEQVITASPVVPPLPDLVQALPTMPTLPQWREAMTKALALIDEGELDKIVLAASSGFRYEEPADPMGLLARLRALTPGCYHFAVQLAPHVAFVGAPPELLCQRQGSHLQSEAVAGTRRRGANPEEEARLTGELLESAKDRREHQFVVDFLRQALSPCCREVETDNVSVLKLSRVQHLCVHVKGTVREGVDDAAILSRLHPTPAVGGWPTDAAVARIAELEPVNRGWYAGPVGWIGRDALQLGVAIRSGLVNGCDLRLFAGAGLVKGSQIEQEWQEIHDKLSTFRKAVESADTVGD